MMRLFLYIPLLFVALTSFVKENESPENAIRKLTSSYVDTYNKHDARTLTEFWADDAEYTNPESGEIIQGRDAIEKAFQVRFNDAKDLKMEVKVDSVTFPANDKAIETGVMKVSQSDQDIRTSAFKAFFEKKDGSWIIGEIRDVDLVETPNQYKHLKELEWLIGEWVDEDDDVEIHTINKWDESKNLIFSKFSVITEGKLELSGMQIIAWDPIKKKIRSWMFDSDGGFGESTFVKKEKSWVVVLNQTLADGSRGSAINIFTNIEADSYTWESTNREVGGELLPDIESVKIVRKRGN
jgi:uncharacterized protein (TIGR02246 family)